MENQQQTQLTAAQRLTRLENALNMVDETMGQIGNQFGQMVELISELRSRSEALERVLEGEDKGLKARVNLEVVSMRVKKLDERVQELVASGLVIPADTVSEKSFLVGREVSVTDGSLVSPRSQFWVSEFPKVTSLVVGKKIGDQLLFTEDAKAAFEIESIYDFKAPEAAPVEAEKAASDVG